MNEAQIKHMVSRFLAWRLPNDFNPDAGISYARPNYHPNLDATPTGTNLFDGVQTEAMVRYLIEGMPGDGEEMAEPVSEKDINLNRALQSCIDDFERNAGDLDHAIMVMDYLQEIIRWRMRGPDDENVKPQLADYMQAQSQRPTP